MDENRRRFLKGALAAVATAAIPALETAKAEAAPLGRFDIRNVYREMGLQGTGPFLEVPVRVKQHQNASEYSVYLLTIDAGLLKQEPLTPEEIPVAQKIITQQRGYPMTDEEIRKSSAPRQTVAFVQQFNPEIYMSPEQMRQHIPMYANDRDDTLRKIRDSFRNDLRIKESNTLLMAGIIRHLILFHGMETYEATLPDGRKIERSKAVDEGFKQANRARQAARQPSQSLYSTPESLPV